MFERLKAEAQKLGKPAWRPMLAYVAELHERSVHPPRPPFALPWEEIGPGYCYRPAFGHWDIIHAVLDVLPAEPDHAANQIANLLATQQDDGMLPGVITWRDDGRPRWVDGVTHPPVWPLAVQDHADLTDSAGLIERCLPALERQIAWFERNRRTEDGGFYYLDVVKDLWESGVDEGVRFHQRPDRPRACVDATAHVFALYDHAARWGANKAYIERAAEIKRVIREMLFDEETGFFHDVWAVGRQEVRTLALEGMWPLVVGAATEEQAQRVIHENLLNPERFFTPHPVSTVGVGDPRFELRMWRGPAWNSMTLWAARGCRRYGRGDAAHRLAERALDDSAAKFAETGTVWEFYHPLGSAPTEVRRKPHTPFNAPCRDYLGHNPLLALARLWEQTG